MGRPLPTEAEPKPKIFRMQVFAPNELVAKSKYWYFMKRLKNLKRAHGEILRVSEIFERKPTTVKNFGVWIRYDSRSGTHNMYKEYRELSRADAIAACCAFSFGFYVCVADVISIYRPGYGCPPPRPLPLYSDHPRRPAPQGRGCQAPVHPAVPRACLYFFTGFDQLADS